MIMDKFFSSCLNVGKNSDFWNKTKIVFNSEKDVIKNYDFSELDEISLAYAISIHKSQGSEYPAIVIPLAMQHFMMLARNLLYTAVTRGKQLVVIIGEPKALAIAVNNTKTTKRITNLCAHLQYLAA